jgi:hypothetical protein
MQIREASSMPGHFSRLQELGNSNAHQDAYDEHDDHDFDECKTPCAHNFPGLGPKDSIGHGP